MENKENPLLVCMTATKNYGWVINAFLKANLLWADYIIVVDQMSSDGSREICRKYPNVILLDNDGEDYSETKRVTMAINRAREIRGDKILFYLAIDEVLPANVNKTKSWQLIVNSKQGNVFCLKWANLLSDREHYHPSFLWMARIFHDDDTTPYDNQGLDMHTHCIPYPKELKEGQEILIDDFPILHFGIYNQKWNESKQRFYQFVDYNKNHRSIVSLSRMYNKKSERIPLEPIHDEWIHNEEKDGFNLFNEVYIQGNEFLDNSVLKMIEKHGVKKYHRLDIWTPDFISICKLKDPRSFDIKLLHSYLRKTQNLSSRIIIRIIDKILKYLY